MDNTFVFFPLTGLILSACAHTLRQKKVLFFGQNTSLPYFGSGRKAGENDLLDQEVLGEPSKTNRLFTGRVIVRVTVSSS